MILVGLRVDILSNNDLLVDFSNTYWSVDFECKFFCNILLRIHVFYIYKLKLKYKELKKI